MALTHSLTHLLGLRTLYVEILQVEKALDTIPRRSSTMRTGHLWLLITQDKLC